MNKKEAICYAQITLEKMLSSNFKQELNLQNFELEMKAVFKIYPKNMVLQIAEAKVYAEKQLQLLREKKINREEIVQ